MAAPNIALNIQCMINIHQLVRIINQLMINIQLLRNAYPNIHQLMIENPQPSVDW